MQTEAKEADDAEADAEARAEAAAQRLAELESQHDDLQAEEDSKEQRAQVLSFYVP